MFISVNISPKDFYFINVLEEIKKLTAEYGVSPSQLRIEITETVMMTEAELRMKTLSEFRKMGYIVETDDQFNTLNDMGCKLFQGYYFAKPMPLEEFEDKFL